MINKQWYGILDSKEVPKEGLVGVTRLGYKLALWRDSEGNINCIFDRCCHRGASISCGEIIENRAQCPFHGFQYDGEGKVRVIPANGVNSPVPDRYRVDFFYVKEAYNTIWLWNEISPTIKVAELPEIPFFKELREGYSYGGFSEVWPVHYTRAVENQLDVVHLPFVHRTTIGRGNRTLVNGPVVKWKDDLMTFYVDNDIDRGNIKPLKPEEIINYESLFRLQLQMPNIWQNIISDQVRIVAIFAPIDEENTRIYLRFYQNFVRIPVLKDIVNFLSRLTNAVILHQDRRVVITQLPKKTELKMDEKLIQGDLPILEFRKKREELKNKNED